ncbi:MAG: PilW family protein [Thiotrichales bacterium]
MTRVNQARPFAQRGFTLVELMVSMVIGLVTLGAVIKVYLVNNQTYRTQTALSAMQQSARYALDVLGFELRMAGFSGCGNLDVLPPNVLSTAELTWPNDEVGQRLVGSDGDDGAPDALTVARGGACGAQLNLAMTDTASELQTEDAERCEWEAGALLMIADCGTVDVFEATDVAQAGGSTVIQHSAAANASANLSMAYGTEAQVMALEFNAFSIQEGPTGEPALFRGNEVLVEGVEDLQLRFGFDNNGDRAVDAYVEAGDVTDWYGVLSVEINLLLRTPQDGLAVEPQTYTFNGETVTATDRRLRRSYTQIVTLRNRVI